MYKFFLLKVINKLKEIFNTYNSDMALYKNLSYENQHIDIETVKGIQFSILGQEEILKRSVCEVTKMDTYNGNEPVINGLFDIRMGAIEFNKLCGTVQEFLLTKLPC